MYHHVVPSSEVGQLPFAVSRELFSQQMKWLVQAGFETISLEQLFNSRVGGHTTKKGKPVVITFDDCSVNLLDYAVPELDMRSMTATFFAVAGKAGGYNDWDTAWGVPEVSLMSGRDLRDLSDRGFEIGSHGLTHTNLRKCPPEQLCRELGDSRRILEDTIGRPVRFFAYPFGEYPKEYADYCREAGYQGAVSIFSNSGTVCGDPFCMRRVQVHEGDQQIRFRFKLSWTYRLLRVFVDRRVLREAK